jgi:hypothetical protein
MLQSSKHFLLHQIFIDVDEIFFLEFLSKFQTFNEIPPDFHKWSFQEKFNVSIFVSSRIQFFVFWIMERKSGPGLVLLWNRAGLPFTPA